MKDKKENKKSIWKSYVYLVKVLFQEQRTLSVSMAILTILQGFVPPAYIWLTGIFVSRIEVFLNGGSINPLIWIISLFVSLLFIQQILSLLSDLLKSYLKEKVSFSLQIDMLQKASELDLSYFEHHASYEKMHRANKVFGSRIINVFQSFMGLFSILASMIGYVAILFSVHFVVCIIIFSVLVPSLFLKIKRSNEKYNIQYYDLTPLERKRAYYESLLTNVEVLKERKNYNLFDEWHKRWKEI